LRLLRPSIAVFVVALLASMCIHFPIYEVLGSLADRLLKSEEAKPQASVEFELAPLGKGDVPEPEALQKPEPKLTDESEKAEPEKTPPKEPPKEQPKVAQQKPEPKAEPKPKVEVVPEIAKAEPTPPPPLPEESKLAVTQKSDDPNVPPPENARFSAEENRRVQEETVASIRNMQRDDPEPRASNGPTSPSEDAEGNADETKIEDLQDVRGSDERPPDEKEASHKPERASQDSAGSREAEAVTPAPQVPRSPSKAVDAQRASGTSQTGGEPDTIVVQDGAGSFTIHKRPEGRGAGDAGGAQKPGQPSESRRDREGARAQNGVNLRLSWSAFERTFGAEELEAQRAAYIEQKKSSAAGHSRQRMWKDFRAAIENFVPNVQPGTQTALNAAADPFANYLAVIHRRIHQEYAFGFLRGLPLAGGPFSDPTLHTELEIVINGDGSVHKVGVAQSSGFLPFDYGAFNAVMKAAPYPQPPRKILSGDGRVYVHWGFYRNERQCGTFNARPYILPHPGDTPAPGQRAPMRDDTPGSPAPSGGGPMTDEFGALLPSEAKRHVRR
jgi:TonB family protein